jgi:hypothetical protein
VGVELVVNVFQHRAGHLVAQDAGVDPVGYRIEVLDVPALELVHVMLDVPHGVEVQAGVVLASLEGRDNALGRRLRSAPGKR